MSRPTVLIATTEPSMSYALSKRLSEPCRKFGLKLEICPEGGKCDTELKTQAYASAEELFDFLAAQPAMTLADTLVVLDVGVELEQAFQPASQSNDSGWHVTKQRRAGVAVELLLRFPQVFPVFLSPAVPMKQGDAAMESSGVIAPAPHDVASDGYQTFFRLREALGTKHLDPSLLETEKERLSLYGLDQLQALLVPLHFISPLDGGGGMESTITRFAHGMRCWFDATGLRTLVKNRFLGTLFGNSETWRNTWENGADEPVGPRSGLRDVLLERLDHVTVAVDEEREFAMLNAYSAYKFGRRAWMVTSYEEFNEQPLWNRSSAPIDSVVLRDIDLRFPDIPDEKGKRKDLKDIMGQSWASKLSDDWRIRVVSSHPNVGINEKFCDRCDDIIGGRYSWKTSKKRLLAWPCHCRRVGQYTDPFNNLHYFGLPKPISTLYDIMELVQDKDGNKPHSIISRLKTVRDDTSGEGGHGAPYLNLAMAESLLQQAGNCEKGPAENLIGALLASEACELLLGMSRTTALEALMMLHKREVAAETGFPGVSGNIDILPRREEIEKTLDLLFEQNKSTDRKMAQKAKNLFLSRFWADLRPVYRDAELFDPAEAANRESLIYSEWMPVLDLPQPRRLKKILVSVATGVWAMAGAAMGMWFIFTMLYAWGWRSWHPSWECNVTLLKEVILTSLALQPTEVMVQICKDGWLGWVLFPHIGLSYLLFGLFVSIFHRKITRG